MPMQYKTRGQSAPQGKNRVYFCCHSEDFPLYFDRISEDILQRQNCAIWYDENGVSAPLDEDRRLELGQMQLFVMPVTARLLAGENQGLDAFRFAMEQHIPVLPLIQEPELEDRFNKICGDIQFLKPYDRDPTAVPYEEKLEKYLNAVLVGDELAQRVRDAFDAYIFLSYRKKDRKYAQELMRLIHQNDFCRDIAIWYDEYLTPGENFNDAIADAMAKSQLFTLAVTPNLVNEENYVMTVEYPEAKKNGKTILPVEVVSTDRAALEAHYLNIPDCVNAHDEAELSQALLDSLKHIALQERQKDPLHTFFIGLAYLSGIDVEVDHKRAEELITKAANSGLPEAMRKLAEMYRSGAGIELDHNRCIYWMTRLLEERQNLWQSEAENVQNLLQTATENELDLVQSVAENLLNRQKELFADLLVICEDLERLNRWETAEAVVLAVVKPLEEYSRQIKQSLPDVGAEFGWLVRYHADFYARLSRYSMETAELAEGPLNYEKAKTFAQRSIDLARQEPSAWDVLAMGYRRMMEIARRSGDRVERDRLSQELLEMSLRVYEETDTPKAKKVLAMAYESRGASLFDAKRRNESQEYYQKAEQLFSELASDGAESPALGNVQYMLGRINYIANRLGAATEYFQKAVERGSLWIHKYGYESVETESLSLNDQGDVVKGKSTLLVPLRSILLTPDIRTAAYAYKYLGLISWELGLDREAVTLWKNSLNSWRHIPREAIRAEDYASIANFCSWLILHGRDGSDSLGSSIRTISVEVGDMGKPDLVEESCRVWEQLVKRYPNMPRHMPNMVLDRLSCAKPYMIEAAAVRRAGVEYEYKATSCYLMAEDILEDLEPFGTDTPEVWRMLAKVKLVKSQMTYEEYIRLLEMPLLLSPNNINSFDVTDSLRKSLELYQALVKEYGEIDDILGLSEAYRALARISGGETAEDYRKKSIYWRDRAEKSRLSEEQYAALAGRYFQNGDIDSLEKSCRIWNNLASQNPNYRPDLEHAVLSLAESYMTVGRFLLWRNRPEEEIQDFDQKAEPLYIWLEENTREDAESYRTLLGIYRSLGRINLRKQQYDTAEIYFQRAGEMAGKMTDAGLELSDFSYRQLSEGYKCLEQINDKKGETEKAKIFCEQSTKYKECAESRNCTLKRTLEEWTKQYRSNC